MLHHLYHIITFLIAPIISLSIALYLTPNLSFFVVIGQSVSLLLGWRLLILIYRRVIILPREPLSYGKWAIVTGSTSGIGKDFADYLACVGLSIVIISRSESKLIEQKKEIEAKHPSTNVEYILYDFGQLGEKKMDFYQHLEILCEKMHDDGGIGLLVNNVGTANEFPKRLEEFSVPEMIEILNCNIFSTTHMVFNFKQYYALINTFN
jgi:hypothetical protein